MTPNGYADSPVGDRFVQPDEHCMPFRQFLEILYVQTEDSDGIDRDIAYVQKQNSSLTDEFFELLKDTGKVHSFKITQKFKRNVCVILNRCKFI